MANTMTNGQKAGRAFIRIGEYISAYGSITGAFRAAEHLLKFRLRQALRLSRTRTPAGRSVHLRAKTSDLSIFREIFINAQYEVRDTIAGRMIKDKYDHLVSQGITPLIIDVGGNIGLASIYFADLYPKSEIILVEMSKENIDIARLNTRDLNVKCIRKAAWPSASDLIIRPAEHFSTLRVEATAANAIADQHVSGVTLDEVVGEKGKSLFLVKMDVEGAEAEIFLGKNNWLDHRPALFIEPHDEFFENCRSLPGLMQRPAYQKALVVLRGATIVFVPEGAPSSMATTIGHS